MKKLFMLFVIILGLGGCSSKQVYHNMQSQEEAQCKKDAVNISQLNQCLRNKDRQMSYEEYERLRKEAAKKSSDK